MDLSLCDPQIMIPNGGKVKINFREETIEFCI